MTKSQTSKAERLANALFLALCNLSDADDEVREGAIFRTLSKLQNMGMNKSADAVRKLEA